MHTGFLFGAITICLLAAGCLRDDSASARPGPDTKPDTSSAGELQEGRTVVTSGSLRVGDVAPSLACVKWVKGEGVREFEKGTIYVLDFMATWCGPCVELMPHLSEIAERHRNDKVRVVGICIWESSQPLGNHASYEEKVRAFSRKRAEQMRYDAGYEGDEGELSVTYMRAADRVSIPTVFVIGRDGRIAWIGHPSMDLDAVVAQLVSGVFDAEKHKARVREREANRLKGMQLARRLQEAMLRNEHERALALCDEILAMDPLMFAPTRVSKFKVALTGMQDVALSERVARDAMDFPSPIPAVLAAMAAIILLEDKVPERDLALASTLLDRVGHATTPARPPQRDELISRLEALLPGLQDISLRMHIESQLQAHRAATNDAKNVTQPASTGGG